MEDACILDLYFERSERAIAETQCKYGRMLLSISFGILRNREDASECEDDTYMKTWNTIPPARPLYFRPSFQESREIWHWIAMLKATHRSVAAEKGLCFLMNWQSVCPTAARRLRRMTRI